MPDRFRGLGNSHRITPAKFAYSSRRQSRNHPKWLALAAFLVIALPYAPLGNYALYPFFILTTWFHEMGHGLTAMLVGMHFERLVIMANGSGYALTYSDPDSWNASFAIVSAGGPLGPAFAGAAMILASAARQWRRFALLALGAAILISTAVWVRSVVGWAVLIPTGIVIIAVAERASDEASRFALQFLGIHAAISMFGQWDYLFSNGAIIGGMHQRSDTGAMAQQTGLPYWFWAAVLIGIGTAIIGASLWRVLARPEQPGR